MNHIQRPSPITWELAIRKPIEPTSQYRIGILSLQGDYLEHIQTLQRIGIKIKEVRLPKDLEDIQGIIFPGGESTTMIKLIDEYKLRDPLIKCITHDMPVWGTCAGMILLAKKLIQNTPVPLGVMNIEVSRNAFGRQIDSFEANLSIPTICQHPIQATFIRAPIITHISESVTILARLPDNTIVAAKEKNMIATSFHPELTADTQFHEYFAKIVKEFARENK